MHKSKVLHHRDVKAWPIITYKRMGLLNCSVLPDGRYDGRWINGGECRRIGSDRVSKREVGNFEPNPVDSHDTHCTFNMVFCRIRGTNPNIVFWI